MADQDVTPHALHDGDVHKGQQVCSAGAPLRGADAAMVMLHGRGGSARDILGLAASLSVPSLAFLAPQAAGNSWYPHRFLEPAAGNEPQLSSALAAIARLIVLIEAAGVPAERIILLGFSQGACLAAEFVARAPRRYGGVVLLSGGLIGLNAEVEAHTGDLRGTSVILGCGDGDFHIPLERVKATTRMLAAMGARVKETIYPGMGHEIVEDEIRQVRALAGHVLQTL